MSRKETLREVVATLRAFAASPELSREQFVTVAACIAKVSALAAKGDPLPSCRIHHPDGTEDGFEACECPHMRTDPESAALAMRPDQEPR